MALDKQRILSELGDVVNQLQSADCGCMGKLFDQGEQPACNPMSGGYGNGCWHGNGYQGYGGHARHGGCAGYGHTHGYAPSAGAPMPNMNMNRQSCMGRGCNPTKLYSDTYNYLNQNLMQPVVKEVYDDLKSITAANTLGNSPVAAQMGTPTQGNMNTPMGGGNAMVGGNPMGNAVGGNPMGGDNAMNGGIPMGGNQMGNDQMGGNPNAMKMGGNMGGMDGMNSAGMGPNIVDMYMKSSGAAKRQMAAAQGGGEAGAGGMPEQYNSNANAGNYASGRTGGGVSGINGYGASKREYRGVNGLTRTANYMSQPHNAFTDQSGTPLDASQAGNIGQNPDTPQLGASQMGTPQMRNLANATPPVQQTGMGMNNNPYGIHAAGVSKFNEMFPGVMQGLGGDLNFDPMAMALQMNPANVQQATMNNLKKVMTSSNRTHPMNSVVAGAQVAAANVAGSPTNALQDQTPVSQVPPEQSQIPSGYQMNTATGNVAMLNQPPSMPNQSPGGDQVPTPPTQNPGFARPQQVYHAIGDATPAGQSGGAGEKNVTHQPEQVISQAPHEYVREPIYPANASNFRNIKYNTIGQPVSMLPPDIYHVTPVPSLQQAFHPDVKYKKIDPLKFSNVKNTVSKTSLIGLRSVARIPSRSKVPQVHQQYHGSQSHYSRPNIQGASNSDGKLYVPQDTRANLRESVPIDAVSGDSARNNVDMRTAVAEEVIGRTGDVAQAGKPHDAAIEKAGFTGKGRNGLQDQVFTSYPTSTAWSFHGEGAPRPQTYFRRNY